MILFSEYQIITPIHGFVDPQEFAALQIGQIDYHYFILSNSHKSTCSKGYNESPVGIAQVLGELLLFNTWALVKVTKHTIIENSRFSL